MITRICDRCGTQATENDTFELYGRQKPVFIEWFQLTFEGRKYDFCPACTKEYNQLQDNLQNYCAKKERAWLKGGSVKLLKV